MRRRVRISAASILKPSFNSKLFNVTHNMQYAHSRFSRRSLIQLGGASWMGLNLGGLWHAQAAHGAGVITRKPIRACILIFYYGGPSHLDTYDLKPGATAEIRGTFKPISTSVPGVQISEHLPRMANVMNKVALIRSVHHRATLHDSASIHALIHTPPSAWRF